MAVIGGMVRATSGDGLLLLQFVDGTSMGPTVSKLRAAGESEFHHEMEPDITRFVCNPVSCDLFRLPDIDGMKKVKIPTWHPQGLLTQSVRGHGPPDRYAVAELSVDGGEGEEQSFVMRRFLSDTGEWEKLVGLPSPLPLPRRINMDHEVVAFAGRLYWVDLTWGAVSADPFSDRPELRFVELPRDSVMPVPSTDQAALSMHRRIGASEGRLRYVELSQEDPFLLSSFTLGSDGRSWTLEHQVVFSRIDAGAGAKDVMPRIGVVDPLNASIAHLIIGNTSLAVEMSTGKVLQDSAIEAEVVGPGTFVFSAFLKACVLPPRLASSRIPPAGNCHSQVL